MYAFKFKIFFSFFPSFGRGGDKYQMFSSPKVIQQSLICCVGKHGCFGYKCCICMIKDDPMRKTELQQQHERIKWNNSRKAVHRNIYTVCSMLKVKVKSALYSTL